MNAVLKLYETHFDNQGYILNDIEFIDFIDDDMIDSYELDKERTEERNVEYFNHEVIVNISDAQYRMFIDEDYTPREIEKEINFDFDDIIKE